MPKCDFNKVPNIENNFMKSEIKTSFDKHFASYIHSGYRT